MKDCWSLLGIEPTEDLSAIRRAYLALVKKYHPDRAFTPEQKRRYTIICARINQAYEQATEEAKSYARFQSDERTETARYYQARPANAHAGNIYQLFRSAVRSKAVVILFLFVLIGVQVAPYLPVRSAPEAVKTAVSGVSLLFVLVFVVVVIFIYGVIVAGPIDLLLIVLFPRKLVRKLGLASYENKILWLLILISNIILFFFTDLIKMPGYSGRGLSLYDGLFRALAVGTLPLILAVIWLKDLIRYKQAKKHVGYASAAEDL